MFQVTLLGSLWGHKRTVQPPLHQPGRGSGDPPFTQRSSVHTTLGRGGAASLRFPSTIQGDTLFPVDCLRQKDTGSL